MRVIKQLTDTGSMSESDINDFCSLERKQLLDIVPEPDYLDYSLLKTGYKYKVLCSYRERQILAYTIDPQVGLDVIDNIGSVVNPYIVKILCGCIISNISITDKEKQYMIDALTVEHNKKSELYITSCLDYMDDDMKAKLSSILALLHWKKN